MTIPARLENLEKGQSTILLELGDMKGAVGELVGLQKDWIEERKRVFEEQDRRFTNMMDRCQLIHNSTESRLNEHAGLLESIGVRLATLETSATERRGKWSLAKTLWVSLIGFVGLVGTTVGIVIGIVEHIK